MSKRKKSRGLPILREAVMMYVGGVVEAIGQIATRHGMEFSAVTDQMNHRIQHGLKRGVNSAEMSLVLDGVDFRVIVERAHDGPVFMTIALGDEVAA